MWFPANISATVYYVESNVSLSLINLLWSHYLGGKIPFLANNIATVYFSLFYISGLWYK